VAELLKRISSREITEWMAFSQLEPFGADAQYVGHAITASTIANVNRGENTPAYSAADFMPKFGTKDTQTVEDMIQTAEVITHAFGGKDLRNKDE